MNKTDVSSSPATFHEWMKISEIIIGDEGMAIFTKFVLGKITFDECVKQMSEVFPEANYEALAELVRR